MYKCKKINHKGELFTMNKLFLILFSAFLTVSALANEAPAAAPAAYVPGVVNVKDSLNLRTAPGLKSFVVGSVPDKTVLKITRVTGSWLEVEAPETLKIYISEVRIRKDGTLAGEVNMRNAMDSRAPSLGILPKGTKVERTDERRNGWVRIKVPAGVKVYAAAFFVKYDYRAFDEKGNIAGTAPEKEAEKKEVNETPEEKNAPEEEKKTEEKSDVKTEQHDEAIEVEGVLTRWKYATTKETGYVLLSDVNGYNNAFVFADDETLLSANENKRVKVSGKNTGKFGGNGVIMVKVESITVL
jgi:hypothetical protein